MDYAMVGPALVLGLGCIGSSIGCGIGGMASHAVMSRVEENHGKFIGMSAVASSQSIYGFVLMLLMKNSHPGRHTFSLRRDWHRLFCGHRPSLLFYLSRECAQRQESRPQPSSLPSSASVSLHLESSNPSRSSPSSSPFC